jgi:C4-type Zn-finger protein
MGKKDENILNDFEKLIEETSKEGIRVIDEVAKSRLKEYKAIQSRNLL